MGRFLRARRAPFLLATAMLIAMFDVCPAHGECADYGDYGHWLGTVPTPGQDRGVMVSGDHAYIADRDGLQVLDLTDPSTPVLAGHVDTPGGNTRGVQIAGSYAYVIRDFGGSGLTIVDVSDPDAPFVVGSTDTPDRPRGIALSGTHAYVADTSSGLQVVDVSKPAAPLVVGSVAIPGGAVGVAASGTDVYVAGASAGLQIVDASDPTAPFIVNSVDPPGTGANGVSVSGDHVCVAAGSAGLYVVDVANPSSPQLMGSVDPPQYIGSVVLYGNVAFTTGVLIVDISEPSLPTVIGAAPRSPSDYFAWSGGHLYVAGNDLAVFATPTLASPPPVGELFRPRAYPRLSVTGDLCVMSWYHPNPVLELVQVTDPASPVLIGELEVSLFVGGLASWGNHACYTTNLKLSVVELSTSGLSIVGETTDSNRKYGVVVLGDYAYASGFFLVSRLQVYDISDPTDPRLAGSARLPASSIFPLIAVSGDYAYVAGGSLLQIVDVSNVAALEWVSTDELEGPVGAIAASGDRAYIGVGDELHILDVSDPAFPVTLARIDLPSGASDIALSGNFAYVAAAGVHVVDVSVPKEAKVVGGILSLPTSTRIERSGEHLFTAVHDNTYASSGLRIYARQCDENPVSAEPFPVSAEAHAGTSLHMASPNPFRSDTHVRFSLAADTWAQVAVYDVAGRVVRTLVQETMPAGEHSVTWQGRGIHGRSVAAGTYFIRLSTADADASRKVVFLGER